MKLDITLLKKQKTPKIILYDSYIQTVKNSAGSNLFRNLYVEIGEKKKDVLENGNLSCAMFVSSILYLFKLISDLHTTVSGTVVDLKKSGWIEIKKPRVGAILVWETKKFKNSEHKHLGFYIGNGQAVSNRYTKRHPLKHHWMFGIHPVKSGKAGAKQFDGIKNGQPVRKVEQIFWNNKLNK